MDDDIDRADPEQLASIYAQGIYAIVQPDSVTINPDNIDAEEFRRYQYRALENATEIRLLRLCTPKPGSIRAEGWPWPECEIFHTTIAEAGDYVAISYSWGPLVDSFPIIVKPGRCLQITRSAFLALGQLRYRARPLPIWIDQLCIDQYDLSERKHQVSIMDRIYAQASETHVWLGDSDDSTDTAFEFIDRVSRAKVDLKTISEAYYEAGRAKVLSRLAQHDLLRELPDADDAGFLALLKLFESPWFTRLWTFQEIFVSSYVTFLAGRHHCSLHELLKAMYLCSLQDTPDGITSLHFLFLARGFYQNHIRKELIELLNATAPTYSCTDPRDKIYALLNIQSQHRPILVDVDYSLPVRDVYMFFAKGIASQMQSLRIFELRREAKASNLLDFPSWAPDLSLGITAAPLEAATELKFSASDGRKYIPHSGGKATEMVVVGKLLDQVHGIVDHAFVYQSTDLHEYLGLNILFPHLTDYLANRMPREDSEDSRRTHVELVLMRTVTADGLIPHGQSSTAEELVRLAKWLLTQTLSPSSDNQQAVAPKDSDILSALQLQSAICICRRLLVLDKHLVALGPQNAQAGDCVCILHGSSVPHLLRPLGNDSYKLIGQCYVDGVMYGEAVSWLEDEASKFILI